MKGREERGGDEDAKYIVKGSRMGTWTDGWGEMCRKEGEVITKNWEKRKG